MLTFSTLSLFSVGFSVASIIILGFSIFFNNKKSATNRAFLMFSFATALWGAANYVNNEIYDPSIAFIYVRATIALAVWQAFTLFCLFFVFPKESVSLPRWLTYAVTPLTFVVSLLCFTPLVFERVGQVGPDGRILQVITGPGIFAFGVLSVGLVLGGLALLVKKTIKAETPILRRQFFAVLLGATVMFVLIILFNFIFPAFLKDARFVPLGSVFIIPFVALTAYAILKHHLLNAKVISAEIITFVLAVVIFVEVVVSKDVLSMIVQIVIFILILSFGILLVGSVRREVEQRERLQKLTEEMEATNAKLTELSAFKSQLLSLASHQIKSPLAVIKGFTDILLEGLYGPMSEKVKETVLKIRHSADELISLINTLLDLRQVDEGRMEFEFAKTNLLALAGKVVEQLRPLAAAKSLEMTFSGDECMVRADEEKLRQVIQNLVDNAIKYTPGGRVNVTVTGRGASVQFAVEDTGLGVPGALLPHLFEEFVRDERVKKQIRGTGLGLYIARRIVEAHGGKIWAESPGEGKGSRFVVELSAYGDAAPPART